MFKVSQSPVWLAKMSLPALIANPAPAECSLLTSPADVAGERAAAAHRLGAEWPRLLERGAAAGHGQHRQPRGQIFFHQFNKYFLNISRYFLFALTIYFSFFIHASNFFPLLLIYSIIFCPLQIFLLVTRQILFRWCAARHTWRCRSASTDPSTASSSVRAPSTSTTASTWSRRPGPGPTPSTSCTTRCVIQCPGGRHRRRVATLGCKCYH